MPRKKRPRLGLYYLVLRGPEGRDIFPADTHYPAFVDVLTCLTQETCYRVYAFCLLPGRAHLAVRMSTITLQDFIQRLILKFGERVRLKRNCPGTVFMPPQLKLVEDRGKVRELIRFIHLLPLKSGQDPATYAWSGHRTYLGKARMPCIDLRAGLGLFGAGLRPARERYVAFVQRGREPEGAARFARQLAMDAVALGYDDIAMLSRGGQNVPALGSLEELTATVSRLGERRPEDLRSNLRERKCVLLRAVIAWHAYRLEIASLSEIAGFFRRDPSTLYAGIKYYSVCQPALFREPGNLEWVEDNRARALEWWPNNARPKSGASRSERRMKADAGSLPPTLTSR